MNIGIIGTGGVGGYFGGKLTRLLHNCNAEHEVYFLARDEHLAVIKAHGLLLSTQHEGEILAFPTLATDSIAALPVLDLCLLCVKSYDLMQLLPLLKTRVNRDTRIIPLLNGVDIYDRVKAELPDTIVYPACVYVGTYIERPGKVTQQGGTCTILFGTDPAYPAASAEAVCRIFTATDIKYSLLDNPFPAIWEKYIFIAAFGMITASSHLTLGQVLENEAMSRLVKGIMQEIAGIAAKRGVPLVPGIVGQCYHKAKNFPHLTKTSLQRDFEAKNRLNEAELFGDTIIRLGRETGIAVPVSTMVNEKLKAMMKGQPGEH